MVNRILIVAAPLTARSGVYKSLCETVQEARERGSEWYGLIGMRTSPLLSAESVSFAGVRQIDMSADGYRGRAREIRRHIAQAVIETRADLVISMIPQSDVVLRAMGRELSVPWVAYVRGQPWPGRGEAPWLRRRIWKTMEVRAMRGATEVWTTTDVLADQLRPGIHPQLIPAGIEPVVPLRPSERQKGVVWSARHDVDKNGFFFLDVMRHVDAAGSMFGAGPLTEQFRSQAPPNVELRGWAPAAQIREETDVFVGTSTREGFGRAAVEAAMSGRPIVISDRYGAAPLLFKDPELKTLCVLPLERPKSWAANITRIMNDDELSTRIITHVQENSSNLRIDRSVSAIANRSDQLLSSS